MRDERSKDHSFILVNGETNATALMSSRAFLLHDKDSSDFVFDVQIKLRSLNNPKELAEDFKREYMRILKGERVIKAGPVIRVRPSSK